MKKLVTRESLEKMIHEADSRRQAQIVGRALVHIFQRQTKDERDVNTTRVHNGIGFTPADAHSGCISAKVFIKHRGHFSEDWQWQRWIEPNAKGVMRIAKYWNQLNEVANFKAAK